MEKSQTAEGEVVYAKASTAMVTRTISKNGEKQGNPEAEEETVAIHRFVTEPAKVSCAVALTMNLGNYESARIDVHLSMPCYKEEIDEAFKFAQAWVENRVEHEKNLIRSYQGKATKGNPL